MIHYTHTHTHHGHWDALLLSILDELGPAVEVPLTPGCNDLDVGLECIVGHLKADLEMTEGQQCLRYGCAQEQCYYFACAHEQCVTLCVCK